MLKARSAGDPQPDLTSMVVTHRAIREDLDRLAALLGEIAGHDLPPRRARAIGCFTRALLAEICAHHQDEDDIVWPLIAATAGQAVDLAPLTDDHRAIEAAVGRVSRALASLRVDPDTPAELRVSISDLRDMVADHMADEEQQIFPAMRRYLSAGAYRWCEQQIRERASRSALRFTVPWLARHAQPDELPRLLAARGWPARIVLVATRPGYARLERRAFGPSSITHFHHNEEEER